MLFKRGINASLPQIAEQEETGIHRTKTIDEDRETVLVESH
jgi:hypothetical protein